MTTDFRFEWQDLGAGDRRVEMERQAAERGDKTDLWGTFLAATETDSMVANLVRTGQLPDPDPTYQPDPQRWREKFTAQQIPEEYAGILRGAVSEAHEDMLIQQIRDRMSAEQYLADAGWSGIGMRVAVGLLDPASLALNAVPMGWAVRGGAVASAVKSGLAVGAMNAGQEAVLAMTSPTHRESSDVAMAALTGFAMGAPIGGVLGSMYRKAAHDTWLTGTLTRVQRTPEGEKELAELGVAHGPVEGRVARVERGGPVAERSLEGELLGPQAKLAEKRPLLERPAIEGELVPERAALGDQPRLTAPPKQLDLKRPELNDMVLAMARAENDAFDAAVAAAKARDMELKDLLETAMRHEEFQRADATRRAEAKAQIEEAWAQHDAAKKAEEAAAAASAPDRLVAGDQVTIEVNGKSVDGVVKEELPDGTFLVDTGDEVRRVALDDVDESDGGFIAGGSIGSGQRIRIQDNRSLGSYIQLGRFKFPLRWDLASHFDRWGDKNPLWRKLGRAFVDDPGRQAADIGVDGKPIYRANEIAASEFAEMEFKRSLGRQMEAFYSSYDEWAQRMKLPMHERLDPRIETKFFEDVGRVVREPDGPLAQQHPELVKAANAVRSENKTLLARLQKAGWEGADQIKENDLYLMRKWDLDTIGRLTADPQLKKRVPRLVEEAMLKVRPDLDPAKAQIIAKHFVSKLKQLRRGDARRFGFLDDGGRGRLQELLRQGDVLDESEIDNILDWVYGTPANAGDAGQISRLKKRTFMDESHRMEWVDDAGVSRSLSISDLLVNDVRELQSIYTKQIAGATAFARKGYRSLRDIQNAVDEAVGADEALGLSGAALDRRRKIMEGAVRSIMGQPWHSEEVIPDSVSRILRGIRHMNFIQYMGQVGFASVPEYAHILATHTIHALDGAVPAYKGILKMAKAGKLPKDLLRDLKDAGVVLDEGVLHRPIWKQHSGSKFEKITQGFENVTAKGANVVGRLSGIQVITTHQRNMMSQMYARRLIDMAVRGKDLDSNLLRRLATNGIDGNDVDELFESIKKYAETDGKEIVGVDVAAWESTNPRTFDLFRNAVHRESYRAIQEVTLGSTPPWLHNEFGKLLMQFRSFAMTAWIKQLGHGLAHMDLQTFLTWTMSVGIAAPMYVSQTYLNYHGDREKLNKLLTPEKIALAAFQRAGFSSMLPAMVDSTVGFATGDPVFAHGRTTGLAAGVAGVPTVATLDRFRQLGSAGAQSAFTDDYLFLEKDARALTGLIPNLVGIRGMLNTWVSDFPDRNYLRQYQED